MKTKDKVKLKGRIYTPNYIVCNILDLVGYQGDIRKKHVMENSCGDGAFLKEIVRRYCEAFQGDDVRELQSELEEYIHGIEIDEAECQKCIANLDALVSVYGIENVSWDIRCGDAMMIEDYNGKMDYVLGNPPYVRVHNLGANFDFVKRFSFAQSGMTDLFIVFYEIGLRMLNENGVLGYITPSSFFNSVAGKYMRKELVQNNNIEKIVNLRHYQAFDSTTYTTIAVLRKQKENQAVAYYTYDEENREPIFVENLEVPDFYLNQNFYFASKQDLCLLKKIFNHIGETNLRVKNGYATLADDVFVGDFPFESKYIRPVIKASRGQKKRIIFPYDETGKVVEEVALQQETELYAHLLQNREKLLSRSSDTSAQWYSFGRSQAIMDTFRDKLTVNTLFKTVDDVKLVFAPSGTGVYSGLYITGSDFDVETIKSVLQSEDFMTYVALLGKYKSGGYYTVSAKDLTIFLNYKLNFDEGLLCYE